MRNKYYIALLYIIFSVWNFAFANSKIEDAALVVKSAKNISIADYNKIISRIDEPSIVAAAKALIVSQNISLISAIDIYRIVTINPAMLPYLQLKDNLHNTLLILAKDSKLHISIKMTLLLQLMQDVYYSVEDAKIALDIIIKSEQGKDILSKYISQIWSGINFTKDSWQVMIMRYSPYVNDEAHIAIAGRAIFDGKIKLATLCIKAISDEKLRNKMETALKLSQNLAHETKWRNIAVSDDAISLLLLKNCKKCDFDIRYYLVNNALNPANYGEQWWKYFEKTARELYLQHKYLDAYRIASRDLKLSGNLRIQQLVLAGVIAMHFDDVKKIEAIKNFTTLLDVVRANSDVAQAMYLLGMAYKSFGSQELSQFYLVNASKYPMSFYGQMALKDLNLNIISEVHNTIHVCKDIDAKTQIYHNNIYHWMIEIKYLNHDTSNMRQILLLMNNHDDDTSIKCASVKRFAASSGVNLYRSHNLSHKYVGIADVMESHPWPKLSDFPLIMSIIKTESAFNKFAVSNAGAKGLMQLMDRTAMSVASKSGIRYNRSRLFETEYNIYLGSQYLQELMKKYDSNLSLAVAAYNAGPSNVDKWLRSHTIDNHSKVIDIVLWIEGIPIAEAREYVKSVTRDYNIYKAIKLDSP